MSSGFSDKKGLTFPIDKILFMIACFYLGLVVSWLFYGGKLESNAPAETVSQPPVLSPSQKQFIGYMRESLRQIDRKAKTPASKSANLPEATVAVPPPPPQATSGNQEKIIERIYVPIYPQNAPKVQPSPVKTAVIPPPPLLSPHHHLYPVPPLSPL
ncbi:MAG: hypothetical protein N5P05_003285 [Chroococcopsis gigantea SAG 12.99]|nr:hypothetical protein [Chroococcopsis gigantea SAG 12.99]